MKVLIVGDPPGAPGGIAQVMNLVSDWCSRDPSIETRFLDPLGKATSSRPNLVAFAQTLISIVTARPSVIHFNTASRGSTYRNLVISQIARLLRIPYVIHLHGGGYPKFLGTLAGLPLHFVRSYFQHASKVVALTPSWKQFVVDDLGVSELDTCVIPNGTANPGVSLLKAHRKSTIPTFVYAGRLTAPKGVPELVEAFCRLPKSLNATLTLIGDGKDQVTRAALAEPLDNVTELGWCTNSETLEIMAKAWAVVLPSHFENMPLTILEAMSVSTAVLATKVGGIPEVVRDNVDGILLPPGDVNGLVQALLKMCDLNQSIEFGVHGRERWLENYTSSRMCESISDTWRDVSK